MEGFEQIRSHLGKAWDKADDIINKAVKAVSSGRPDLFSVQVHEDDESYIIEMAVPGFPQGAVNTSVDGDVLTVSAKPDKPKFQFFGTTELRREFVMPRGALKEKISASHTNGVLRVVVPVGEVPHVKISVS